MENHDRRKFMRYEMEAMTQLHVNEATYDRALNDLSGSGASLLGKKPANESDALKIRLEKFGEFSATVVRDWDDGFAVSFDAQEDDQYSLQEDIESFMRENDLWDD